MLRPSPNHGALAVLGTRLPNDDDDDDDDEDDGNVDGDDDDVENEILIVVASCLVHIGFEW